MCQEWKDLSLYIKTSQQDKFLKKISIQNNDCGILENTDQIFKLNLGETGHIQTQEN